MLETMKTSEAQNGFGFIYLGLKLYRKTPGCNNLDEKRHNIIVSDCHGHGNYYCVLFYFRFIILLYAY